MSDGRTSDDISELAQLRRELAIVKRQLVQTQRVAETSEKITEQSKRAMLRTNADLQRLVGELRSAKVRAEDATEAKSRFLAVMTHELRTPLHGMIGSADLLLSTGLTDQQAELVQLLRRSGASLLTIVNDILDYSRIEAGMMQLESLPFVLPDCVREVLDLQLSAMADGRLRVRCELDPALPAAVRGDEGRLRQVLNNLVNNAIKFTAAGEVVVGVAPAGPPDLVRFTIRDTGVGIAAEAMPRLFQAFVQEDASTTRRFGGTGLGLAICRRLVQLMGGEITATSEPGRGSVFTFTCKLTAAPAAKPVETAPSPQPVFAGKRVLIVDDHDANRLLMHRMLERLGCEAEQVADGVQAVKRLAEEDFAVVLMDCSMPVMDGYEATRQVRQGSGARAKVPILALTANALPEDRQRCLDAGMDGYLSKPVRLGVLQAELARVLGR
ncbi:MAG: ATP-binding protein [Planctomycetes bacterium]|nr:ATP-binding protein [Planctomycetota bacterium]